MNGINYCKKVLNLLLIFTLLELSMPLLAQNGLLQSDVGQITRLMAGLSDHSKSPAASLDPNLDVSERDKNLKYFNASHYELNFIPTGPVHATAEGLASVTVRVHFIDTNRNELDTDATVQFVKRNGEWYFANFAFLGWPYALIAVLIITILVVVGYVSTVLVLGNRLLKQGSLGANALKVLFPIFWFGLFRKTQRGAPTRT